MGAWMAGNDCGLYICTLALMLSQGHANADRQRYYKYAYHNIKKNSSYNLSYFLVLDSSIRVQVGSKRAKLQDGSQHLGNSQSLMVGKWILSQICKLKRSHPWLGLWGTPVFILRWYRWEKAWAHFNSFNQESSHWLYSTKWAGAQRSPKISRTSAG